MVRIRFPPAESPQTIGSSAAERDLPSARDENRHRQSPLLAGRQSAPEVGIRPSTGITRLHRCRVGGGALDCSRAGLRPPLKLGVQFSRTQLSRRRSSLSGNGRDHRD